MNHSMPGLPVHHQLLEFTQTHVHRVSDAIQPSHPLSSPSLLPPIPPSIRVFSNESTLRMRWPKYWSFSVSIIPSKEISGLISFRMDWLDLIRIGTLKNNNNNKKPPKEQKIASVGGDMEKLELLCTIDGIIKWFNHCEKNWVPKNWMLLNCGVGEDSWESLGLQGDPTSPFWRRSALSVLLKEWC